MACPIITVHGLPGAGKTSTLKRIVSKHPQILLIEEGHNNLEYFRSVKHLLRNSFTFRLWSQAMGFQKLLEASSKKDSRIKLIILDNIVDPEIANIVDRTNSDTQANFELKNNIPKIYVDATPEAAYLRWLERSDRGNLKYSDFLELSVIGKAQAQKNNHTIVKHDISNTQEQLQRKLTEILITHMRSHA